MTSHRRIDWKLARTIFFRTLSTTRVLKCVTCRSCIWHIRSCHMFLWFLSKPWLQNHNKKVLSGAEELAPCSSFLPLKVSIHIMLYFWWTLKMIKCILVFLCAESWHALSYCRTEGLYHKPRSQWNSYLEIKQTRK